MKSQKRKTFAFEKNPPPFLQHKRKPNSTFTFFEQDLSQTVVFDVINYLLSKVYEEQGNRAKFIDQTLKKLAVLQVYDILYFNLQGPDEQVNICKQDPEPPAEENRCLEVIKVPSKSKKTIKNRGFEEGHDPAQSGTRMSIMDPDKRDRQNIIQKLKKEYSMILQSKYFSQTSPVGESRSFFVEADGPEINTLRKGFTKVGVKKLQKHKASLAEEPIRKNQKLNTIFKKSKNFVETIDPTMSNSVCVSQIEPQTGSRRGSVVQQQEQQSVVVKLSKFKQISNAIKAKYQLVSQKNLSASVHNTSNAKMINLVYQQQRQALKMRVERSFHSNQKSKFREVAQTERMRPSNAISSSFLPKIGRI